MSLSKATAQTIAHKRPSNHDASSSNSGESPPGPLTAKLSTETVAPGSDKPGRLSRTNSLNDCQHLQHELKAAGDLVFTADSSGAQVLRGGSFPKLLEWALASAGVDDRVVQNFAAAYRQWKPPTELWRLLMDRFDKVPSEKAEFHKRRIGHFICTWADLCLERDFFTRKGRGRLFNKLLAFTARLSAVGQGMLAYKIKIAVLRHRNGIVKLRADAKLPPKEPPKKTKAGALFTLFDHTMNDAAQQLALIESELFSSISTRELFNLNWKSAKARTLAPNIGVLVDRFNQISYWITTEILLMAPGARAGAIQHCIELSAFCLEIGNYNSLMEVLAGLNHVSVTRLKDAWAALPPKHVQTLAELNAVMENQHNYRVYRDQLQSRRPPYIPYLGIYLRDFTFVEEGNRQFVEGKDGVINYEKLQLIGELLREFMRAQRWCRYGFKKMDPLHKHLLACDFNVLDDEKLYQQSTEFRPVLAPL